MRSNKLVFVAGWYLLSGLTSFAQQASSIHGMTLDESGKSLPDVKWRVSAIEELINGKWTFTSYSGDAPFRPANEQGQFVIPLPATRRYDLQFQQPGFAPAFLYQVGTNSSEIKVTLKRGQVLHGTVTELAQGKRIANEKVVLRLPCRDFWYQDYATTGPSGEFEFRVCAPPFTPATPPGNILRGKGEPPRQLKWQLVVADKVVEVQMRDGEPIKPVEIELEPKSQQHAP